MNNLSKIITGLRVDIVIECETEDEVLAHLSAIRATMKKKFKKIGEVADPISFEDDNCYGWHEATIKNVWE